MPKQKTAKQNNFKTVMLETTKLHGGAMAGSISERKSLTQSESIIKCSFILEVVIKGYHHR